jgi:integrase
VRTFLGWCADEAIIDHNPASRLRDAGPLRSYRRTYGKVQAANPGRWLSHSEAYGQLVGACQDGTVVGLRDEIAIRLGLMGMRRSEICALTVASLRHLPSISWTGKGHKPLKSTASPSLVAALTRWLALYPNPAPASPVLCRARAGTFDLAIGAPARIQWGQPLTGDPLRLLVVARAAAAGLGHVSIHDLRRSAAGILHNATTPDGAHHFDLMDIQQVLHHADPVTTMRSYLEPMDTDVHDRAANFLD